MGSIYFWGSSLRKADSLSHMHFLMEEPQEHGNLSAENLCPELDTGRLEQFIYTQSASMQAQGGFCANKPCGLQGEDSAKSSSSWCLGVGTASEQEILVKVISVVTGMELSAGLFKWSVEVVLNLLFWVHMLTKHLLPR